MSYYIVYAKITFMITTALRQSESSKEVDKMNSKIIKTKDTCKQINVGIPIG